MAARIRRRDSPSIHLTGPGTRAAGQAVAMTHVDSPSLTVPPFWAELYFDTRDADGARLREILAGDPRLRLAGFADFLEQERLRLKTLSIYAVGVLIVEVGGQGGADEPPGSRPWPVEPTTALHLVE